MSETTDIRKEKLRAFFSPIFLVILIAIVLTGLTLSYYTNPETPEIPDDVSIVPENPDDPFGIAYGAGESFGGIREKCGDCGERIWRSS